MSDAREAVSLLIQFADDESFYLLNALRADWDNEALQRRMADWNAGKGEFERVDRKGKVHRGGFQPDTGTAKLIRTLTRNGCGAFDKAYQWACELVRSTPAATSDLAKLEALHKAHEELVNACRKASKGKRGLLPPVDAHAKAMHDLALSHSLYMSGKPIAVDAADPFVVIRTSAATLADSYPVVRAEHARLSTLCESAQGREMFADELKAESERWDKLEERRRALLALLTTYLPNEASALRETCKVDKWDANDLSIDMDAVREEMRSIIVDACRRVGASIAADEHATPKPQGKGETSIRPPAKRKKPWLVEALMRRKDEPDTSKLSHAQLAKELGKATSTLTRDPMYRKVAGLDETPDTPKGHQTVGVDGGGNRSATLDCVDESPDWTSDIDERIDREEENKKRQRNAERNGKARKRRGI